MNFWRRYKITIEDESHLTQIASRHFRVAVVCVVVLLLMCVMLVAAGAIIAYTPLRTLLPGYLKESQRTETEESLMRLDSLMAQYDMNKAYIDNFLKVIDTDRQPGDSVAMPDNLHELTPDSLMQPSEAEKKFVSQMEERERFNISVLAPLAAESMIFYPITGDGVFAKESATSKEGVILLPRDENVMCAADGSVLAKYYSPKDNGYVVVIQHNRGFVTSYSHVGTPMVETGEQVNAGQMIAMAPKPDSKGTRRFAVRMWHNGLPIVPFEYLGKSNSEANKEAPSYEAPRGTL